MEKKIMNFILIIILILFTCPILVDIFYRVQTNNFYKTASNVLLQANVDYVKNKDVKDYQLYIDFSDDRKDFNYFDITSGDLILKDEKVAFALYSQYIGKCAFKKFSNDEITIIESVKEDCTLSKMYKNEVLSSFTFKDGVITKYSGPSDVLIPSTINGQNVKKIGERAFANSNITSVYIEDGIEEIEEEAFINNNITKVTIEGNIVIGDRAFMNNLIEEININSATYGIDSFKNNLLGEDKAYIKNGNILMSYGGNKYEDIVIPDDVEYIEATFNKATGAFNTGNGLKEIPGSLFENQNLKEVVIGNNVKTIGKNSFKNNDIEALIINSSEVIEDSAFENNQITSIILPNNLSKIGSKTFKDNEIYDVTFNSSLDTIGSYSFMNNWLTRVEVKVNTIEPYAFMNNLIEEINIDCNNYGVDSFKNNLLKGSTAYISNGNVLMSYGGNSRNIIIPSYITKIEASFDNVTSFDFNNVTEIKDYFLMNNTLESIKLSKVKSIGINAFSNNNLQEVVLPETIEIIGNKAFSENPLVRIHVLGKVSEQDFEKVGFEWNGTGGILYEIRKDAV